MLEIRQICKQYKTGELTQTALDAVSLRLRDSEFVSVLGSSGSGKTTLLNIIGGLDRYDSGDLLINGKSTKQYSDRDWDTYRNHSVGFVFQNYNLIPHLSVLANVELALTIGGESREKRRQRARKALEQVGLGNQLHKKPNQMSGGQMQRVAIARALVNDPEILLADEPTGALDSETSIKIMDLLREVARDRLVIMVTHNSELAEEYSTRIVRLKDGRIIGDSDPCTAEELAAELAAGKAEKKVNRSHMSFATALALSFNNLKTKKKRTMLTSFAGSIGIIGIALILALSTGVNSYISALQMDTMASYPITLSATTYTKTDKLSKIAGSTTERTGMKAAEEERETEIDDAVLYTDFSSVVTAENSSSLAGKNDLTSFKKYLENPDCEILRYVGENGIVYTYNINFDVYSYDADGNIVSSNAGVSEISDSVSASTTSQQEKNMAVIMGVSTSKGAENFEELISGNGGNAVSSIVKENYDLLAGKWPGNYDEVVLVLDSDNTLSAETMYQLGLITAGQYTAAVEALNNNEEPEAILLDIDSLISRAFYILPACDHYVEKDDGTFAYREITNLDTSLMRSAIEVTVSGVIRPAADAENAAIGSAVGYTAGLTSYIIEHTAGSPVITAQQSNPGINVLNGLAFEAATDEAKVEDAKAYLSNLGTSEKASWYSIITAYLTEGEAAVMSAGSEDTDITEEEKAAYLDDWLVNAPDTELLIKIYDYKVSGATYDDNMSDFGLVSFDEPASISIYADSFEAKESIAACIENYNAAVESDSVITYTDYVSAMTASITSMIDMIALVLIAFVAVSLIVSCIMISIITHISVLERTREIGVLRALGASKRSISQVFNAETFIVGICAGFLGVAISALLTIPINAVIASVVGVKGLSASLPVTYAVLLVAISIAITVFGGLVPSKKAAKMDPVAALRSE